MTAISSPVIADIAGELARHEVDVFIIYMGNNEVVGPFGPGTVLTDGRLAAWLTPMRVALSGSAWPACYAPSPAAPHTPAGRDAPAWSGMEMFEENHLTEEDPRLRPMAAGFERNLRHHPGHRGKKRNRNGSVPWP